MRGQLVLAVAPGGDGHSDKSGGPGAVDIARRVAKHIDIVRVEADPVFFHRAGLRHRAEFVAIDMVVGEGAEFEIIPHAVVREFQLRALLDVSGEQSEHAVLPLVQRVEQFDDPGKDASFPLGQLESEMLDIPVEKVGNIFRGVRDGIGLEHLPHDGAIGRAGERNRREVILHPEALPQRHAQGVFTGASGQQKGSVDVEEQEFFSHDWMKLARKSGEVAPKLAGGRRRAESISLMPAERVLAVDPSLRGTGYAVLETSAGKLRAIVYGVVKNPPKLAAHQCLREIHETLSRVAAEHQPTCFAIEGIIYVQNVRTAIVLGSARGAALLVAAGHNLEVHEYAPRLVKQAVVGRGGAQKEQVAFMIRAMLGLKETPPSDAADALAIGMTHFNRRATAIK